VRKRAAILAAAEQVFLRDGYAGTSMDAVTAAAAVSKQTVYNHFGNKEDLFVGLVTSMVTAAAEAVHVPQEVPEPEHLETFLRDYALRQLTIVLDPRLLRLRRLVIGEQERFPDLGRALWDAGPQHAMSTMATLFGRLAKQGVIINRNPRQVATFFTWIVMSAPLNEAMLLGDGAVPDRATLRRHVREAVRVFLAAYRPINSAT
jgi:AcrR family transcriptional regulator